MTNNLSQKLANNFICETCNYNCRKNSDWIKHLSTGKHKRLTNTNNMSPKIAKAFECDNCGKKYKHAPSLCNHKKGCLMTVVFNKTNTDANVPKCIADKDDVTHKLVELIMSKNQEFITELVCNITNSNKDVMEKMMEIMPKIGNNSHNTNSNNTTNNQFNIQMFLNEHCKNAMNLTDFIDSLPITAATYDSTIENGLTKTITNMITNGLNKLDILERPIHCTDATRKTIYVKEADVWEKDTELLKVVDGIKTLIRKKRTLICRWKEANRGWDTEDSKQMRFTELICNIMTDVDFDEKETGKIVRSISKSVYLDNEDKKKYLC